MKPDEWMPLNVGHYLRDTARLTRDQHGAYLLLLFAYWTNGGAIAADDAQLAATVKATRAQWRRLRPIIAPYFQEQGGLWFNKRAERELAHARDMVEKKSRAGKAGAEARWDSKRNANPVPPQSQTDAPRPRPLPESPSHVPEGFPDREAQAWAEAHWREEGRGDLCALMDEECARFRDYHNAQDKTSADWSASWRNWVRKTRKFAQSPGSSAPRGKAKILTILDEDS